MPDIELTSAELTRPIIGIENRTPQEVFDIMCDRVRHSLARAGLEAGKAEESMRERAALEAEGIGEAYGMDETGWTECSETIATAIRALPPTGV